jgi:FRG domain
MRHGISAMLADELIGSGYMYRRMGRAFSAETTDCLADTFYGIKEYTSLIPLDDVERAFANPIKRDAVPEYSVKSIAHARAILAADRHRTYIQRGGMSFRGQLTEYFTRRAMPNPRIALPDGRERLIVPSIWRPFHGRWNDRFTLELPPPFFSTIFAEHLIYYGIPDWETLDERNFSRYGFHTLSDLEDFPDSDSREYGRRWRLHKVEGPFNSEMPALEQHYGMPTAGLDVTFDLATALFFATHRFVLLPNGCATFLPIPDGAHDGVVYCIVFESPRLRETSDLLKMNSLFDHLPPERPRRQHCALPMFWHFNINEAVPDSDAILHLDPLFDREGIPLAKDVFPIGEADPFYHGLMALRDRFGDDSEFGEFPRYTFDD